MKTLNMLAAAFAAASTIALVSPATAQSDPTPGGHYEWRQGPQFGPHAPVTAPRRVWVANGPSSAHEMTKASMVRNQAGHYEWRATLQPAPRAPLAAPRRVWVSDPQLLTAPAEAMATAPQG